MVENISKRDYFAAMAMQGIIQKDPQYCKLGVDQNWENPNSNFTELAKCSYLIADAMIKQSNNEPIHPHSDTTQAETIIG